MFYTFDVLGNEGGLVLLKTHSECRKKCLRL
jgi:hypothetical protein